MIAREWKARCPKEQKKDFIKYLYQTGVKDTSSTKGFKDAQILSRDLEDKVEITLITYWDCLESIKTYAGDDIEVARLYPEDFRYELEPDDFVIHYEVINSIF
ncbi:MAG: antibiotic biosynthesis monooxygenase [Desulfobacterales bacterium]|nr:antibiotic biosynthesis monooxygenase [Desulfobacterales bacterium]MCP4163072.1 antibiotic biosynthesis monooxygenase [Deltaproteobacteria bacterium]